MKKIFLFTSLIILSSTIFAFDTQKELSALKQNYKEVLLYKGEDRLRDTLQTLPYEKYFSDQMVVELHDRYPITKETVEKFVTEIKDDGSWGDIDYESKDRSGWRPKIHVERILILARCYANENHVYHKSEKVESTIHKALKFWYNAKLVCPNWWYNQIGVPKTLGAAVILFEDKLTAEEKAGAIEVLSKSKFGMTGQNKVWLAGNVLVRALLEEDFATIQEAQEQIFSEIKIGEGKNEGIKTDWSFHQHGAQQQFGNYGTAFIATTSFWAKVFSNTSLAIDQERLDLLHQLITKGYQRVIWKGYLDINGLGRQMFKQTQRHKGLSAMFSVNTLAGVDHKNREDYEKLLDENVYHRTQNASLTGLYHFWKSDQTIQRTPTWMSSLKMSSNRVIGTEGGNGDNKKGYYLADGALYTYLQGDEYCNIAAVWDWRKIPGTTVYQTDLPLKELRWLKDNNLHDFVGNVNKGNYGMTTMVLNRDGLEGTKTWLFTPDYILCLGAGISTDSTCQVATTIEQSLQKGSLYHLDKNKWKKVESEMKSESDNQRYFHNGIGYIANGGKTTAKVEERIGSWHDIMNTYPDIESKKDRKNVMTIYQDHGVLFTDEKGYQYLILPNKTQKEVKNFDLSNLDISTHKNVSAIYVKDKKLLFFSASGVPIVHSQSFEYLDKKVSHFLDIKTNHPCMLILDYGKENYEVTISDPTQKLDSITVEVNGKTKTVELPQGEYKGTSVSVSF